MAIKGQKVCYEEFDSSTEIKLSLRVPGQCINIILNYGFISTPVFNIIFVDLSRHTVIFCAYKSSSENEKIRKYFISILSFKFR